MAEAILAIASLNEALQCTIPKSEHRRKSFPKIKRVVKNRVVILLGLACTVIDDADFISCWFCWVSGYTAKVDAVAITFTIWQVMS